MKQVLGVDIGTSSLKAAIITETGELVDLEENGYPSPSGSADGITEQDPEIIFSTLFETVRKLLDRNIKPAGIAFSSAMHSLMAVDSSGNPITPLMTWADIRSSDIAKDLRTSGQGLELFRKSGAPMHSMLPLTKVMWLKNNMPDVFLEADKFIGIKEYVLRRLGADYFIDHSTAGGTGFFTLADRSWDPETLALAGIEHHQLPELVSTTKIIKDNSFGIPIVCGAADGCLANLGEGVINAEKAVITVGTSGAIRTTFNRPVLDPQGRLFCYPLDEKLHVTGGPVNNGGVVVEWFRDKYGQLASDNELEKVEAGIHDLIFLPFVLGERAPFWDPDLRESFHGRKNEHTIVHLHKAVLEGVIFNLKMVFGLLEECTGKFETIRAGGGFFRTKFNKQLISDIFGRQIEFRHGHSSVIGAGLLGLKALGIVGQYPEPVAESEIFIPDTERTRAYDKAYMNYRQYIDTLING